MPNPLDELTKCLKNPAECVEDITPERIIKHTSGYELLEDAAKKIVDGVVKEIRKLDFEEFRTFKDVRAVFSSEVVDSILSVPGLSTDKAVESFVQSAANIYVQYNPPGITSDDVIDAGIVTGCTIAVAAICVSVGTYITPANPIIGPALVMGAWGIGASSCGIAYKVYRANRPGD